LSTENNNTRVPKKKVQILNQLVIDCNTYNLSADQALVYIKKRLGHEISAKTLERYKKKLKDGYLTDEWLQQFARVGFATIFHELLITAQNALLDTNQQLFILTKLQKMEHRQKREELIIKLKFLQLNQIREVQRLSLSTPVIAQMKAMIREEILLRNRDKLITEGNTLEEANEKIMKELFLNDSQKRKLIIVPNPKILTSDLENRQYTTGISSGTEEHIRSESETEQQEQSIENPDTDEFSKITDRYKQEKRDLRL